MSKNYKNLYEYELPVDLQSEWSKIEDKLDENRRKNRFLWWFFTGGSIISLFLLSMFLFPKNKGNDITKGDRLIHEVEIPKIALEHKDVKVTRPYGIPSLNSHFKEEKISLNTKERNTQKVDLKPESDAINLIKLGDERGAQRVDFNESMISLAKQKVGQVDEEIAFKRSFLSFKKLSKGISIIPTEKSTIEFRNSIIVLNKKSTEIRTKASIKGELMYGFASRDIIADNSAELYVSRRKSTEAVLDIVKARMLYQRLLTQRLIVSGGIDFTSITERFRYNGETTERITEDVEALAIYTDYKGNVTTSSGEKEVIRTSNINVLKYNSFSLVSIPIQVAFELPINRFTISISSGLCIPFYSSYQGKIFNIDGGISNVDELLENSGLILKANHGIGLNFEANDNVTYAIGLFGEYDLMPSVSFKNHRQSYQALAANIGIVYRFNK